ncbi:hypothetical protein FDI11_gp59 [Mycobacterium phage Tiger]|uniref:Uncharacterized protein n=3 Tax=Benedictvirus TaxID=2946819 RepID=H9NCU7_9CAUD|nr:hypothetical protein X823_gp60 [Mycobacterium phage Conspiracy]YP_008859058.1 hypothetical protein X816_gp58 [Mycobacterium phage Jovo]YP_009607676.1 hypothetical protein FDI11_gp59 [Mycobacterium phage Tiger]YP_010060913.1 hypothetical protein KIP51_gp56 [Mycobacterium phage Bluefalcon]ATW60007.1 hypothetical protein SEA_PHLORENCE_33 [Mycobacterium phage Phlorence]ATW60425.1 hypothetical protein SEA_FORGETIT_33 [Mycobacterium phage ForGetIt]ATW60979.1 hypothetical protein SEA_ARAGOG_33 [M
MRISELISKLAVELTEHGDVEVYTEDGCGCCMGSREPSPEFVERDDWGYIYHNAIRL